MVMAAVWRKSGGNMSQFRRVILCVALLLAVFSSAAAQDDAPVSIIFMHHSTGLGIIQGGNVREAFSAAGYAFWDHGYNDEGLVNPAGDYLGINWDVPGDNTDPDGWYATFQQPVTDPPANTFSHMLQHDVIIFKSCFPTSDIYDEEMLAAYQHYFLTIRAVTDQHPDKLFIAWTTPPLVPNATTPENAARARRWSAYLTSPEYLEGHPNLLVFDIFDLLADEDGILRAEYRQNEDDSHPNDLANRTVGPIFVDFVDEAALNFVPGEPGLQPQSVEATHTEETETVLAGPGEVISDFEEDSAQFVERWWSNGDADVQFTVFGLVEPGYDSAQALQVTYSAPPQRYGSFGYAFDLPQDWSASDGIAFYWRADTPDLLMSVFLSVADPAHPDAETTPFVVYLVPPTEWTAITLTWDTFYKAEWIGDVGLDTFDPAHIREIGFGFGDWDKSQQGTLWLDAIRLVSGE
jgi:hypothetical protein